MKRVSSVVVFALVIWSCLATDCVDASENTQCVGSLSASGDGEACDEEDSPFVTIVRGGPDGNLESSLFRKVPIEVEKEDGTVDELEEVAVVDVAEIPGGESVGLHYVRNFFSLEEISKLIGFCDGRQGWTASPQNHAKVGMVSVGRARTSQSCPLIWPLMYLPRMDEIKRRGILTPELEDEIMVTHDFMKRIATFMGVEESYIEPLQLLRYGAGQYYKQHHDHGSYYGASSEQRPFTFLLFLSTVPANDGGGQTKFNNLDIAVLPRAGDGIFWSNVDSDNELLLDAIHEAMPPNGETLIKYAMNVW
eukprot:CAMPEP_0197826750 /NCGR_PEP_ID=MMETSP1437-20131217/3659_1 /TAXON_ID=49252 ORGANISM="Eucampia antarctica, Strain CCMP1452" /NCGR_SAMPLE_ID=MMETSP1437 /ASSEMBLY_ACC=CAM_ASM_001096 /LENGTH=306 /DNA_ID=CAMNT_0043427319 /DNA_START=30 /DNA_END=947 /DNA_ORIENTATION=+